MWGVAPERFRSQAFRDCFDRIQTSPELSSAADDELEQAQSRLLEAWQGKQLLSRRVLACDTTNFYTWVASASQRNRLALRLAKPQARYTEQGIRNRIARWLAAAFVSGLVSDELEQRDGRWHLSFDVDNAAPRRLLGERLGRTILLSNRLDWSGAQVVAAYSGQQHIERVFRGLKDGDWLGWGPMHHWTDSKIRVHAFCCLLGISLLQYLHKQKPSRSGRGLSMEELTEQLRARLVDPNPD